MRPALILPQPISAKFNIDSYYLTEIKIHNSKVINAFQIVCIK
ncbi:hypothetical protein LEP1GSC170_0603 [Leptospira interrogans serovar Bataviae str. HAI135]|nr:hypothetical protein LEP1GSC170_0603 [Leptospira interrogans serovar Bataviae str. HAI135]